MALSLEENKSYLIKDNESLDKQPIQIEVVRVVESCYLLEYMNGGREWVEKKRTGDWTLMEEI